MDKLKYIVPIDIETVPFVEYNSEIAKKMSEEEFNDKRHFKAQYAKIVAIDYAVFHNGKYKHRCLCSDNEKEILTSFSDALFKAEELLYNNVMLYGHSILDFDIPFITQRMMANKIKIPDTIKLSSKKPYEIKHIDSHRIWKQNSFGMSITFDDLHFLLTGLPGKEGVCGADVYNLYLEKRFDTIGEYCTRDNQGNVRVLEQLIELGLV